MATLCGEHSTTSVLIFTRAHWMLPRYILGFISSRFILYMRWYRYIVPYYKLGPIAKFFQYLCRAPINTFWHTMKVIILREMNLPNDSPLIPDVPVHLDVCLGTEPLKYYDFLRNGKIRAEKTEISQFKSESKIVEFTNGKSEEFDVVIFATGYAQTFHFFDASTIERYQIPAIGHTGRRGKDAPFRLYKFMIPIKGPQNVGFIGFQSAPSNPALYEAQANWLSSYFLRHIHVPNEAERERDVAAYLDWERETIPGGYGGAGCFVFLSYIHLLEDLYKDMKISTTRTSNFIQEYLFPMYPSRFQIRKEKAYKRAYPFAPSPESRYFSFSTFVVIVIVAICFWRMITLHL